VPSGGQGIRCKRAELSIQHPPTGFAAMARGDQIFDVAVIGAGPTGSFASARMAQAGLNVVQLEKDNQPGDSTVCAGGLHRDVVEFVDISPAAIKRRLHSFRIITNGKTADWTFGEDLYMMGDRHVLDRTLSERSKKAGVTLITNARVAEVAHDDASLTYRSRTGESHQIRARVFVFADGANSLGRKTFTGTILHNRTDYAIGVEYDMDARGENGYFDKIEIITCRNKLLWLLLDVSKRWRHQRWGRSICRIGR